MTYPRIQAVRPYGFQLEAIVILHSPHPAARNPSMPPLAKVEPR